MARLTDPYAFSAEGLRLQWPEVLDRVLRRSQRLDGDWLDELHRLREELQEQRPVDIALRWMCSPALGVPPGPFTVWTRDGRDEPSEVDVRRSASRSGTVLRFHRVAAVVDVDFSVDDPSRPSALWGFRDVVRPAAAVAVVAGTASGPGRMRLRLRTSGATKVLLVNGSDAQVAVQWLQDVVDADDWQPVEVVGLPGAPEAYDPTPQGPVDGLVHPWDAAVSRVVRGGPPVGWWPVTEAARLAPRWERPDPAALVDEVGATLLTEIGALYVPGMLPPDQSALSLTRPVDGPPAPAGRPPRPTTASVPPLALLALAASTDPFLALATGFGSTYALEPGGHGQIAVGAADLLVTADYPETHRRQGPAQLAAFVPSPEGHAATAPVTSLSAVRAGLVGPAHVDAPWRESVRLTWDRREPTGIAGRPAGLAVARYDLGAGPEAEGLNPLRDSGGARPLVPSPLAPQGGPGHDRDVFVDGAAEIPLGSGGRSTGYAVAVQDVFGLWSPWEDTTYGGDEPAPPLPRVVSLRLEARWTGTASCPAELVAEVAVDWSERTPAALDLGYVVFPALTEVEPDPPASTPTELVSCSFSGGALADPTARVRIEHLDPSGVEHVPPGPDQGEQTRRYRLTVPVPVLDFGAAPRWRVHLWVRTTVSVSPGAPGPWSPRLGPPRELPARAEAASPVPVAPLPLPPPAGVPVGSTPDGDGRSHVRVRWLLPPGADVDRVVVWEASESAVRQTAARTTVPPAVPPPAQAPEGTPLHERLAQLRALYDALPAVQRRALWRRAVELPRHPRPIPPDADLALPRGSTDLHLFAVTTETSTGVASGLPETSDGVQFVTAPRLRQPAVPHMSVSAGAGGDITIGCSTTSRVPVSSFAVLATRSPTAARSADTMGPPVAILPAGPGQPVPAERRMFPDEQRYSADGLLPLPPSWDEHLVRVVALPVAEDPPRAVRGLRSPSSEAVTVLALPPGPPQLDGLVAELWGPASEGVVVRGWTDAPVRAGAFGEHRLSAVVTGAADLAVGPVAVTALPVPGDPAAPPAGAEAAAVAVRGRPADGRTPLALWFTRATPDDPCTVTVTVVDPKGRRTSRDVVVPGNAPASAPPTLEVLDVFSLRGRGLVVRLRTDAPVTAEPPGPATLSVTATTARLPWWRPPSPPPGRSAGQRASSSPGAGLRPLRDRKLSASFSLPDVPVTPRTRPFPRSTFALTRTSDESPHEYSLLVGLQSPVAISLTVALADASSTTVRVTG